MELDKNFRFKKQFGQNFIFDKNFLLSIVNNLNLNKNSSILEIGAGAGVLTEVLAENYNNVVSFEIDKTLTETLNNLANKHKNLKFVFEDVLKVETAKIDNMFSSNYSLVANLPYYITSQIIFKFLFESKKLDNMFVMVQKEVAERFSAKPSTKEYGIPTVLINTFGECKIIKNVPRTVFMPVPKVDSAIINITINKNKFNIKNSKNYISFVSNCFKMKRKTLYNNLISMGINKDNCLNAIAKLGFNETIRPENLSVENFVTLFNLLN